jgi:hypothetical protein
MTRIRTLLTPLLLGCLCACASAPPPPAPGTAQAWGDLRLVPREGVEPSAGGGSYGDRRLRDVEFVDYTRPGFAVVYVEREPAPAGSLALAIRESRIATEIAPAEAAVGAAGRVRVRNETDVAHVLSYPAAGRIVRVAPGAEASFDLPRSGEQRLFVLDVPSATATLFAAPGPFSVVSPTGRFLLDGLAPGPSRLRVWHPRFPPAERGVELAPDVSLRVDLEIGVGHGGGEASHAGH